MAAQQVDGNMIRRAIEEYGSLKKAIEVLKNEIEALENERALLEKEKAQLMKRNSELKSDNARITTAIEVVDKSLYEKRLEYSKLTLTMMEQSYQYELFQGFMAMLVNSPSVNGSIESLIASLQIIKRSGWYSPKTQKEWMGLFVDKIFGDYLQSFKCDRCGSRFMVSKGTNKAYISYWYKCPACHYSREVKPDDSFLRAMVPEKQLTNIYKAELLMTQNVILRPFKVLLTIPCEVCGELISNWTEDKVKRIATGLGWGHEDCLKTFHGRMKQIALVGEYFPKIEEKSSQQAGEQASE